MTELTRDDVIAMAREAGVIQVIDDACMDRGQWIDELSQFAQLIAAKVRSDEREECEKVCEPIGDLLADTYGDAAECIRTSQECAAAIRARGNS